LNSFLPLHASKYTAKFTDNSLVDWRLMLAMSTVPWRNSMTCHQYDLGLAAAIIQSLLTFTWAYQWKLCFSASLARHKWTAFHSIFWYDGNF